MSNSSDKAFTVKYRVSLGTIYYLETRVYSKIKKNEFEIVNKNNKLNLTLIVHIRGG